MNKLKGRQQLEELSKTGKYVFHGSEQRVARLEPRQAYTHDNSDWENRRPDGNPAVFATSNIDIAIFMAMLGAGKRNYRAHFDTDLGYPRFRVSPGAFGKDPETTGYVYVLNKEDFSTDRGAEFISEKPVKPVSVVEVRNEDLSKDIEVVPEWVVKN